MEFNKYCLNFINKHFTNIRLSTSAEPGLVRNLECHYEESKNNHIICKWSKPKKSNSQIKHYFVKLAQNGKNIHYENVTSNNWKAKIQLKMGRVYIVSVSVVTYTVGTAVSTRINSPRSGKIFSILL